MNTKLVVVKVHFQKLFSGALYTGSLWFSYFNFESNYNEMKGVIINSAK